MILAELAMEAGLPNGVLNIVHGTNVSIKYNTLTCVSSLVFRIDLLNCFVIDRSGYCECHM